MASIPQYFPLTKLWILHCQYHCSRSFELFILHTVVHKDLFSSWAGLSWYTCPVHTMLTCFWWSLLIIFDSTRSTALKGSKNSKERFDHLKSVYKIIKSSSMNKMKLVGKYTMTTIKPLCETVIFPAKHNSWHDHQHHVAFNLWFAMQFPPSQRSNKEPSSFQHCSSHKHRKTTTFLEDHLDLWVFFRKYIFGSTVVQCSYIVV